MCRSVYPCVGSSSSSATSSAETPIRPHAGVAPVSSPSAVAPHGVADGWGAEAALRGANLSGARLVGTNLTGADLTGAVVVNAEFSAETVLTGALLWGVALSGQQLKIVEPGGAKLGPLPGDVRPKRGGPDVRPWWKVW